MSEEKFDLTEFFKEREVNAGPGTSVRLIKVAVRPMTKEQARQAYPYRPYNKYSESRWGGNNLYDDFCLVTSGLAIHCIMCQAPTKKRHLQNGVCPDCDGRAEYNGYNPHQ